MKRFILLGLAFLLLSGCAGMQKDTGRTECRDAFSPHYEDSYFAVGEKCEISAELLAGSSGIRKGSNDIQVILHNRLDQDVTGATLRFFLQGTSDSEQKLSPDVREVRGGLYSVNDLQLENLQGKTLVLEMEKSTVTDRVLFHLQEMSRTSQEAAAEHTHKVMHDMVEIPDNLDTSRKVTGQKGRFKVSYTVSEREEIPLAKFHSWKVHIEEAQSGEPVRAVLAINGDMPRHGHGLPTNPQATFLGNGNYRIDGFKFHMPGWWQVVITVSTADRYDRAVFNFILEQ